VRATPEQNAALERMMKLVGISVSHTGDTQPVSADPPLPVELEQAVGVVEIGMHADVKPSRAEIGRRLLHLQMLGSHLRYVVDLTGGHPVAVFLGASIIGILEQLADAGSEDAAASFYTVSDALARDGLLSDVAAEVKRRANERVS
jgi:hypothetical protein